MRRISGLIGRLLLTIPLGTIMAGQSARADIRIIKSNGQPVPAASVNVSFNQKTGGWEVRLLSLYAPSAENMFDIRANAGEVIDAIWINVDGPASGSPVVVRAQGESPGQLHSVHQIVQNGNAETILNKVHVTHDIGLVQVQAIGDLIAGRDILGPVHATTPNNALRGITNAKAGRHILGDMTADNGRILLVQAMGNIGQPQSPVTIRAKHNLYHVEGAAVYAHINSRYNGGTGGLFALIASEFEGTLTTEKLILNPWLAMEGLIYITQRFDGVISIGKSFNTAGQYIQLPAQGLKGQIIINADFIAGGTWAAPVRVGFAGDPQQIVLNGPNYAHTHYALGGGAVGLVPFKLHDESCTPANGSLVIKHANDPPVSVTFRHYGPVNWTGTLPVSVERRPVGGNQTFVQVAASEFAMSESARHPNEFTITSAGIQGGFAPGYEYRITPGAQLRCAVPAAPAILWDEPYRISVQAPTCTGNANGDSVVNVNDLLIIIAFWGQPVSAFPAADVTGDGVINVNDLLLVIQSWGPCP